MKKLFFFFVLLIGCSSSVDNNYFTWSALSSNQAVSYYSLQDAVTNNIFPCPGFNGSGLKLLTKTAAINTNAIFDLEYSAFVSLGNNDIVTKSDLQPYPFSLLLGKPTSTTAYNTLYDATYETSAPNYFCAMYSHESFDIGKKVRLYTNFSIDTTKFYSVHGNSMGCRLGLIDASTNQYIVRELELQL